MNDISSVLLDTKQYFSNCWYCQNNYIFLLQGFLKSSQFGVTLWENEKNNKNYILFQDMFDVAGKNFNGTIDIEIDDLNSKWKKVQRPIKMELDEPFL